MLWAALDPHHHNQGPPEGSPVKIQELPNLLLYHEGGAQGAVYVPFGPLGQWGQNAGHFVGKQ